MNDPLCLLSDVKRWLSIPPEDERQDGSLDWLIQSCSAQIAEYCGRDNLGSVVTYSENYKLRMSKCTPTILLRHFPVVTLTSVLVGNIPQTILTSAQVQSNTTGGVFLEDDDRTLSFLGLYFCPPGYVLVNYTAGYDLSKNQVPFGLRQAAIQFVAEIYKSTAWIGYRSKSLAGETTTFEGGATWGMSPRTAAMLQPYVSRMPPYL